MSRGSAGEYQADERAGVTGLSCEYQADERAGVARLIWREVTPGKGVLKKREVSKYQETLSLANLWRALEPQKAT